jgi:HTH-type transcriptional regulator, repressor for puuD
MRRWRHDCEHHNRLAPTWVPWTAEFGGRSSRSDAAETQMTETQLESLILNGDQVSRFERGNGVVSVAYVGRWNSNVAKFTTGMTILPPGTGIPLHTHNVEESVLILVGSATAQIGERELQFGAGDATWVPAGVAHRFANAGNTEMRIYWVYAGLYVTRTIVATGKTFEHLSDEDRVAP